MIKFFSPQDTARNRGRLMAQSFTGAQFAEHGDELGDVNLHYGILHGGAELYDRCVGAGKTWVHADYGFIGERPDVNSDNGFFRFSRNSQAPWMGMCKPDHKRLESLISAGHVSFRKPKPLSNNPRALYIPPSKHMKKFYRLPRHFDVYWLHVTAQHGAANIYAPEYVKPNDLDAFDVVVSFNSALGFKALEMGIPVIMTAPETIFPWGAVVESSTFELIRYESFSVAAACHWNFAEMRSGEALEAMKANELIFDDGD